MQILKNEVKEEILKAARIEFLKFGFRKASLRNIAAAAGITVGNIYRYFKSKDALFRELLAPVIGQIELMKMGLKQHSETNHEPHEEKEDHRQIVAGVFEFISRHREDLQLLMSYSGGSSLEKYEDELINWYSGLLYENLKDGAKQFGISNFEVNQVSLYLIAKSVADSVKVCIDKEVTINEVSSIAEEMFAFYGGGSMQLLKSKIK